MDTEYSSFQLAPPAEFQQQVQVDNFRFMIEQHIFCPDFFIFLKEFNFLLFDEADRHSKQRTRIILVHLVNPLHLDLSQVQRQMYANLVQTLLTLLQILTWHSKDFQVLISSSPYRSFWSS